MHPDLTIKIQEYLQNWADSEARDRVEMVEGFGFNHGLVAYEGQTIPGFLEETLSDFHAFLSLNPHVLSEYTSDKDDRMDWWIKNEEKKVEHADELLSQMLSYRFGILDPRYWKTERTLSHVLNSFADPAVADSYRASLEE